MTVADSSPIEALEGLGQGHLVEHARTLPDAQAEAFLAEAAAQPWARLRAALDAEEQGAPPVLRPPIALRWKRQIGEGGLRARLAGMGEAFLAQGRVATFLLAGGQGTRLGHPGPKGTFCLGPEQDRSLYRVLGERIAAASERAGVAIPYYVLVSPATEAATREAFEEAQDWGLADDQVRIISQGALPCVDGGGRGIIQAPGQLAMAPDGHGGALTALQREGVLAELAARHVDVLTTFQVDNPLGRPLDPVMLGWMLERKAHVVSKAVAKASPDEKVGVYARDLEGRHRIVEYSEFGAEGAPEDLDLGSIAIHAFSVRWLHELLESDYELPLHRAHKKVPYLGDDGSTVTPEAPNAIKLEQFIFDVFPEAPRLEVHEVKRSWEFAPIKNRAGTDSPETARALVDAEVRRWHDARGTPVPEPISLRPRELDGPA